MTSSWHQRLEANAPGNLWRPGGSSQEDWSRFGYMVVEEWVTNTDIVSLTLARWPYVDRQGRLEFSGAPLHWQVDAQEARLSDLLRERRYLSTPDQRGEPPTDRPLRIGDVFAAPVDFDQLATWLGERAREPEPHQRTAMLDPREWRWLSRPIYDITPLARNATKAAASAAEVGTLDQDDLDAMAAARLEEVEGLRDPSESFLWDEIREDAQQARNLIQQERSGQGG